MNKMNKASLDLIKSFEGLRTNAYLDAVGVWTIGYGHTAMAGPPKPVRGRKITVQEAEDLLLHDLRKYEKPVIDLVKVPLNDNQYGALVSFVYNLGEGNFRSSTLLKKLNRGDYKSVPSEMMKWDKAGGKRLTGLTRRRKEEGKLFMASVSKGEMPIEAPKSPVEPVPVVPSVPVPEINPEALRGLVEEKPSFLSWFIRFLSGGKNV